MRYAVVKASEFPNGEYRFSKFHESFSQAKDEAERLCKKEGKKFLILLVTGTVQPRNAPVEFVAEDSDECGQSDVRQIFLHEGGIDGDKIDGL